MLLTRFQRWLLIGAVAIAGLLIAAALFWRDDILRTSLDPEEPYQIYAPPPAPDYAKPASWALLPSASDIAGDGRVVDVFFIHPTTFDGGRHWNGPIDDPRSSRQLAATMLPNYAGPFFLVGRVYAPRYRQASLYSYLTLREDAREARRFAYGDVERAFRTYLQTYNDGRPFVVVGVEQGGFLADRLLRQVVAPDASVLRRFAGAYLIRTVVAAEDYPAGGAIPPCRTRAQARCLVAFAVAPETGAEIARELTGRALVWGRGGDLENLKGRLPLCVNPLLGAESGQAADVKQHLGAANATRLEWGVRPAFLPHEVSARCVDGVLRVSRSQSRSLRASGGWADRLKVPGYNVFFADLEADAMRRVAAFLGRKDFPRAAPPIATGIPIGRAPTHRID